MTHIVAAHIGTQENAEVARDALANLGFGADKVEIFYVTPPGERAEFPIGGDRDADPGSVQSARGAFAGAGLGGAVGVVLGGVAATAVPLLAPAVLAGVAATGALGGAIAGALNQAGKAPEAHGGSGVTQAEQQANAGENVERRAQRQEERAQTVSGAGTRRGGLMIAIDIGAPERADEVSRLLERSGAQHIERIDGEWRDGHWVNFDSQRAPPGARDAHG